MRTERDVWGFARVSIEGFEDSPEVAEKFYAPGSLGGEGSQAFIAWEGDQPVGIAAAYLREGAVGIFSVAVVPSARRRGIGARLSMTAARAFPGADLAWLHSTEDGLPLYEALRFRCIRDWEVWIRPPG